MPSKHTWEAFHTLKSGGKTGPKEREKSAEERVFKTVEIGAHNAPRQNEGASKMVKVEGTPPKEETQGRRKARVRMKQEKEESLRPQEENTSGGYKTFFFSAVKSQKSTQKPNCCINIISLPVLCCSVGGSKCFVLGMCIWAASH